MAPTTKLIARDAASDPGFMLLYYALKSIEEAKPNFTKVAESMGLDTANAAYVQPRLILYDFLYVSLLTATSAKRYARLIKVQDDAEVGSTGGNESPAKPKATPGKGGGRKKLAESGANEDGDGVGDDSPSPRKKQRVTKTRKEDFKTEKSVEEVDGEADAPEVR